MAVVSNYTNEKPVKRQNPAANWRMGFVFYKSKYLLNQNFV